MKPGDVVKFVNEVDPGDDLVRFEVLEVNGDRTRVKLLDDHFVVSPITDYRTAELEVVPEQVAVRFYGAAGFRLTTTGGNCHAFEKRLDGDLYVLITTQEDAYAPVTSGEPVAVGLYREGESMALAAFEAQNGTDALTRIASGELEVRS